jgi:tRNA(adenine34) deaminase
MVTHEFLMKQAFREAEIAFDKNEVPIGAVVVADGKILGRGHNMVESLNDPTAHAEIIAITAAANTMGSWRLDGATLYVTKEPCPMCAGAIYVSRIPNVVYGVSDTRMGACGSTENIVQNHKLRSNVSVTSGILGPECLGILQMFFKKLREKDKER